MVRAQGGTPTTVALGRWSIDFYRRQADLLGTDSGFRELGYLILAATEDEERAGRERVAMQRGAAWPSRGAVLTRPCGSNPPRAHPAVPAPAMRTPAA